MKSINWKRCLIIFTCIMALSSIAGASNPFPGIPSFEGDFGTHVAQEGEDLYPISRNLGLAIEHVMFANGMTGIKTTPGQVLTIPTRRIPPPFNPGNGLVINLPERGIFLFKDGRVKKFFPVAIGSPGRWMTPTGDMKIITKVKDPEWFPPEWAEEEEPVPAGPDNPLGDRWMGLDRPGYGIHATNSPVSIGLATSHGCMRMYPEMAHELFEEVYIDMPVKIIYEPVKLGYDTKEKRLYMEVYKDVYEKTPGLLEEAKKKLARHKLLGLVDEKHLEFIVNRHRGIPEAILGTDIVIEVDGKAQDLFFSPISKDGLTWTSSQVLKPIGATLEWNNKEKKVNIYRGGRKVSLRVHRVDDDQPGSNPGQVAYLWNGRTIIPLGYVLRGLGVNFQWNSRDRAIQIFTESPKVPAKDPGKPVVDDGTPLTPTPSPSPVPSPSPSPEPTPDVPLPKVVPDDIPPSGRSSVLHPAMRLPGFHVAGLVESGGGE